MPTAVPYIPRPFVADRARLGDYARSNAHDVAQGMRLNGALSADLWRGIGQNVSGSLRDIAAYPEQQRAAAMQAQQQQRQEQAYQEAQQAKQMVAAKQQRLQQLVQEHGGRVPNNVLVQEFGPEDAAGIARDFDQIFPQPKAPEPYTLNPGDVRFGGDNTQVASVPKPEPVETPVNLQSETLLVKGRPTRVTFNPRTGTYTNQQGQEVTVDPLPKDQRELAREVIQGPNGPLLVNKETGATTSIIGPDGQPVKTAMSAQERMDSRKFSKAAPVLKGIGELSERINTLQGVYAKAAGEVEKQKAKINLNDDVAEYESLVSGFTPMIARALGHTGVLTQQDVDSVKALFPRPGDSKTLRDRKIARMMTIIGELEGVEGVSGVAPPKKNPFR